MKNRRASSGVRLGAFALAASVLAGCNTATEGMFEGAVVGGGLGVTAGLLNGHMWESATIGAVGGAAAGACAGNQSEMWYKVR